MKARLISKTTGIIGTEYEGKSIDEIIVGIARLSSSRDTNSLFKDPDKLLRHCIINGHWSIFTMANLTIEIETSRAIGREMLRHSSMAVQEFCVTGDTKVRVCNKYRPHDFSRISIEDLYFQPNITDYKVLSYDINGNNFTYSNIKSVFKNGEKEVYLVTTKYGDSIECTKEHKFYSDKSFKALKDLQVGSFVYLYDMITETLTPTEITSIEPQGFKPVFDIEVEETHNYIANEILVHNSQRYQPALESEPVELRSQASNNRQSSIEEVNPIINYNDESKEASVFVNEYLNQGFDLYQTLLNNNVSRETARFILPETTKTTLIFNASIRSWITTLNQRLHKTAQKEARDLANLIKDIFIKECPIISKSLFDFDNAENIHILDRLILEKYKMYDQVLANQKAKDNGKA